MPRLPLVLGLIVSCTAVAFAAPGGSAPLERISLRGPELSGEIGRRLNLEVTRNFLALDLERDFLAPFRSPRRPEEVTAQFGGNAIELGENVDAAVWLAAATGDPAVLARKAEWVRGALAVQAKSGYVGVFLEEPSARQLFRNYALEECCYLIVGWVDEDRLFSDPAALAAARRLGDYLLESWHFRPDGLKFSSIGLSAAFLALYTATGDSRYRNFAAQAGGGGMFNDPSSLQNWRQEIYENRPLDYLGARPVTRVIPRGLYPDNPGYTYTADRVHVYALLERSLEAMRLDELMGSIRTDGVPADILRRLTDQRRPGLVVTGAAGWMEGWNEDAEGRGPMGETCATVHLLWFFEQWLRQTGRLGFGDLMERTIYNTLFAAQSPAGRQLRYFTAFSGERRYFELDTYCCPGNFRRGLGVLPSMVYYRTPGGFAVNLYNQSQVALRTKAGVAVSLSQRTDYPTSGKVVIAVEPERAVHFSLGLRIPAWCAHPSAAINGQAVPMNPSGGTLEVDRNWQPGDQVTLDFPMEWRWVKGLGMQTGRAVLLRGPVVYGLNPRLNPSIGGVRPRDLVLDPASIGAPLRDDSVRPEGTAVMVSTRGPAPLSLRFTEFTDPGDEEIYFRLPPRAATVGDELLVSTH